MENNCLIPSGDRKLRIFVTNQEKTSNNLSVLGGLISTRMANLAVQVAADNMGTKIPAIMSDVGIANSLLGSSGVLVKDGLEYVLDFESLPPDIYQKLRKGIYRLGDSKQVEGNLRAVIVDETGTRVKDVTLKKASGVANGTQQLQQMQNLAIQLQLKQISSKLDYLLEMQGYHIELSRSNILFQPFLNARDKILLAQNEEDPKIRRERLDEAIGLLQQSINACQDDIEIIEKRLLLLTRPPVGRIQPWIDKLISYVARDLQLLSICNSVLLQVFDYLHKDEDIKDAYEKYRAFLTAFCTERVGKKQLPMSIQIHNAFGGYTDGDMDSWKTLTDETVPALREGYPTLRGACIITLEDGEDEQQTK